MEVLRGDLHFIAHLLSKRPRNEIIRGVTLEMEGVDNEEDLIQQIE